MKLWETEIQEKIFHVRILQLKGNHQVGSQQYLIGNSVTSAGNIVVKYVWCEK